MMSSEIYIQKLLPLTYILLQKMECMVLRSQSLNRFNHISLKDVISDAGLINCGVPRGFKAAPFPNIYK